MSFSTKHMRIVLVGLSAMAIGAGAGAIASAGAAGTHAAHGTRASHRAYGLRRLARRAVHGSIVVKTATGFQTITFNRGKVDSVSGRQLTMTDGTRRASDQTVTLTIPVTARIRDNHQPATLAALKPGQRVIVIQAPKRTFVIAHTPR
jgi:hypothetical protein